MVCLALVWKSIIIINLLLGSLLETVLSCRLRLTDYLVSLRASCPRMPKKLRKTGLFPLGRAMHSLSKMTLSCKIVLYCNGYTNMQNVTAEYSFVTTHIKQTKLEITTKSTLRVSSRAGLEFWMAVVGVWSSLEISLMVASLSDEINVVNKGLPWFHTD